MRKKDIAVTALNVPSVLGILICRQSLWFLWQQTTREQDTENTHRIGVELKFKFNACFPAINRKGKHIILSQITPKHLIQ